LIFLGIILAKLLIHPGFGLLTIPVLLIAYISYLGRHKEDNPDSPMSLKDKVLLFSGGATVYLCTLLIAGVVIAMR